jgi:hypothetical protein
LFLPVKVLDISRNVLSSSEGNRDRSLPFGGVSDSVEADLRGVHDEGLDDGLEVVLLKTVLKWV